MHVFSFIFSFNQNFVAVFATYVHKDIHVGHSMVKSCKTFNCIVHSFIDVIGVFIFNLRMN